MSYFVNKEYDNGSCKSYHVINRIAEETSNGEKITRLMSTEPGFCMSFEVSNEMKTTESCFSKSKLSCVYGTNFVYHSHIPTEIYKTGKKLEGLRKIKKVLIKP